MLFLALLVLSGAARALACSPINIFDMHTLIPNLACAFQGPLKVVGIVLLVCYCCSCISSSLLSSLSLGPPLLLALAGTSRAAGNGADASDAIERAERAAPPRRRQQHSVTRLDELELRLAGDEAVWRRGREK